MGKLHMQAQNKINQSIKSFSCKLVVLLLQSIQLPPPELSGYSNVFVHLL